MSTNDLKYSFKEDPRRIRFIKKSKFPYLIFAIAVILILFVLATLGLVIAAFIQSRNQDDQQSTSSTLSVPSATTSTAASILSTMY